MAESYSSRLVDRKQIAENTITLYFERPAGFEFKAGQHINIKLSHLQFDDKKGARRTFTISSAPHEPFLHITTRLSESGYKRTLLEGPLQDVEFIGPMGKMVLDESLPAVFIAGGIGSTPFRSMLLDALHRNVSQSITLLYSNRYLGAAAFHELFDTLRQEHSNIFKYIPTMPDEKHHERVWNGETRFISSEFIRDYVDDMDTVMFYLCGPPTLVTGMQTILEKESIDPSRIQSESFWGY